jgi:hypothetical protein
MVSLLIIQLVLVAFVEAARPNDQIVVNSFNQTFLIADETYTFAMIPVFEVHISHSFETQDSSGSVKY